MQKLLRYLKFFNIKLENAVKVSQKESEDFSDHVLKEIEIFSALKIQDFFGYFRDLADIQIEYHQKVILASHARDCNSGKI
jgi:hypothetical protein